MIKSRPHHDTEFMDDQSAAHHLDAARADLALLFSVLGLVAAFFIWAGVSEIDALVRGQGQVVPAGDIQIIQSLEGGILRESLIREGDRVTKGQVLMRISDVQFASEEGGAQARLAALDIRKTRLEAEAKDTAFTLPDDLKAAYPDIASSEADLYASRKKELENARMILNDKIRSVEAERAETNAQISRFANARDLLREELDATQRLVEQRAVPEMEALRLRRELADVTGQIAANREKLPGLEAELRAIRRQLEDQKDKVRSQVLAELSGVETERAALKEKVRAASDRVDRTELRAPVDGVVNRVALNTIGGVVEPAMRLIEIVPLEDDLRINAKVSPNDIAFLHPGQKAKVRISAYDPQIYGLLDGEVTRIGANSVQDRDGNIFFEIEVTTDKNWLGTETHKLPITPGMLAGVDIVTGKRTVLEYLAKPFLRARANALRER